VLDLNYISFSNPNPTHSPKHKTLSPNHQFYLRIRYVEQKSPNHSPAISSGREDILSKMKKE